MPREGDASFLAAALQDARRRTLDLLDAYVAKLGADLRLPYSTQFNPPLWEVGHVAWFYDIWIARNQQRHLGLACDPDHVRPEGRMTGADALYNSSLVAHATRWSLPLPDLAGTRAYLADSLAETLALLAREPKLPKLSTSTACRCSTKTCMPRPRTYMAQALDIPLPAHLRPWQRPLPAAGGDRDCRHALAHSAMTAPALPSTTNWSPMRWRWPPIAIDSVPVSWRRFLPAIEAGAVALPRYLRQENGAWQALRFGAWEALDLDTAAVHLTWDEAAGLVRLGRAPPADRGRVGMRRPDAPDFAWGDVWEWTSSRFAPFAGFVAHPYRDYSRFGFEEHRYVLKGASRATAPRMAHPRYRNYFTVERNDIHTGFRSCALKSVRRSGAGEEHREPALLVGPVLHGA